MALRNTQENKLFTLALVLILTGSSSYYLYKSLSKDTKEQTGRDGHKSNGKSDSQHDVDEFRNLPPHLKRELMKEKKRKEKMKYLSMKSPMYDNVRMVDPQGELLCTVSKKKALWYVDKGIADLVSNEEEGTTILKLRFEPKNRSNRGEKGVYVRSDKKNECVVCGATEFHRRHYVVPFAYRTFFPKQFKSHLSHDIVIICVDCGEKCEYERQMRMNEIENKYRLEQKLDKETTVQYKIDHKLYHIRSCALALLNHAEKIPQSKRDDYTKAVLESMIDTGMVSPDANKSTLTKEDMQQVIDREYRIENPNYIDGASVVATALGDDDEKITEFVKGWRRHFLETAAPRFLPLGWKVDAPVVCGSD